MLKFRRLLTILSVVFIIVSLNMQVLAFEDLNPDQLGSIQITMRYDDEPVSGGSLTIYHVGELTETDDQYEFILSEPFADSNVSLKDIGSSDLPAELLAFAKEHSVTGTKKEIGEDGSVVFEQLPVGLYLLAQETAASGYETAKPFLVSVPFEKDGMFVYDVDASPKVALEKEPDVPPDNPPSDPSLPQTGQLNWPIPILTIAGLLLICLGWFMYFRKRKTNEK